MIFEVLSDLGETTIEGVKAKEYRVFFFDPTQPLSRTTQALVGLFRLSHLECTSDWYVPHSKILEEFTRYQKAYQLSSHMRILTKISEISSLDPDRRETYNSYRIYDHIATFGPFESIKSERYIHIYDGQGGCTGYCKFKDLNYVKGVMDNLRVENLHTYQIYKPKTNLRLAEPTYNR